MQAISPLVVVCGEPLQGNASGEPGDQVCQSAVSMLVVHCILLQRRFDCPKPLTDLAESRE